jgi:nicotinate phosphoribosyltransferase
MKPKELKKLEDLKKIQIDPDRLFYSATHEEILAGYTTDIYFVRTREILEHFQMSNTEVAAEVFANRAGVLAGVQEGLNLLKHKNVEVYALPEGEAFAKKEVIMTIRGHTGILGFMKRPCWAF